MKFNLKKGDALIVPGVGLGVLIKRTRSYWYYMYLGALCKVREEKVWSYIDSGKIKISYGSSMKNRRKKRKGRTLDLHGCAHADAEEKLRMFLNFIELPCKIITGKSARMKTIVRSIVYDYGWSLHEESAQNTGTLIVIEKKGENNNDE